MKICMKKLLCCIILLSGCALITYRRTLRATLLGHYRSEGYNFFSQLYEFTPRTEQFKQIVPASIAPACAAQGIDFNTLTIRPAIVIWGQLLEPDAAPADRIYNVVFHADILGWHGNNDDFNTNILAGIFEPNGVGNSNESIAINQLALLNVHKHDQVYYSPDNGRFQILPNRSIVTFWSIGISEERTRAVITYNVILDNPRYAEALSKSVNLAQSAIPQQRDRIVAGLLREIGRDVTNQEDQEALIEALSVIEKCV